MLRSSNRFSLFVSILVILIPLVLTPRVSAQAASAWQLIWSDEFDGPAGSAPNPQHWTLQQGLTPDGAQTYNCLFGQTTNGCDPNNPNVFLDGNGHLAIVARGPRERPTELPQDGFQHRLERIIPRSSSVPNMAASRPG